MRRLVSLAFVFVASHASAQARFADAAARAVETDAARFAQEAAVLLADCSGAPTATAKRSCITARRRAGRTVLRTDFLVETSAAGNVRFGSYERASGGFRVYVDGFVFRRDGAPGILATAPPLGGRLPHGHIAKVGFVHVANGDAALWVSTHPLESYSLRVIFRLGDDFEDSAAPAVGDRYGVRLEIVGAQIYGDTSGEVLVDSFGVVVPPALSRLEERTRLWSHDEQREGLFIASDGTEVVLDAMLEVRDPGQTETTAVLAQTVGATRTELVRVSAPCCSSSIDVRRHGPTKILAILTEQAPSTGTAGRGRVVLLTWNRATNRFEQRAEWVGSNVASPPAWVLDPNIDP